MSNLNGTKTQQNLLKSFAGESQARNRYTFFASVARKEGYQQIASIFEETAKNEELHAKQMFKLLEGGEGLEITATYPAGKIGTTEENLKAAAAGENEEFISIYPEFANVAEEEGFPRIAKLYRDILIVEHEHELRFTKLAQAVEGKTFFNKTAAVKWHCMKCGYDEDAQEAPIVCPICKHQRDYFEIRKENI